MSKPLYPLTFESILKERIWGGSKLKKYLNKPITSENIGESWEVSTVPESISIVKNGSFKGKNLNELIDLYPEEILGTAVFSQFGKQFPLLFKYLDAREDLSIQLHPNDELAKVRHNSFGKTEMWYVLQADANARLIVGFKENASKKDYLQQ
jgi:mannose-6-phosphate isomerase